MFTTQPQRQSTIFTAVGEFLVTCDRGESSCHCCSQQQRQSSSCTGGTAAAESNRDQQLRMPRSPHMPPGHMPPSLSSNSQHGTSPQSGWRCQDSTGPGGDRSCCCVCLRPPCWPAACLRHELSRRRLLRAAACMMGAGLAQQSVVLCCCEPRTASTSCRVSSEKRHSHTGNPGARGAALACLLTVNARMFWLCLFDCHD